MPTRPDRPPAGRPRATSVFDDPAIVRLLARTVETILSQVRAEAHDLLRAARPARPAARRAARRPRPATPPAPRQAVAPAPPAPAPGPPAPSAPPAAPEPAAPAASAPGFYAHGERVYVVGATATWLLHDPARAAMRPERVEALPKRAAPLEGAPLTVYVPRYCLD